MEGQLSNNRRIAKNTVMLYIRMIVVMLVTLYTSRLVLDVLGVVDYGINSVVGGLVGMFTILSGSLSVSTSRYLTYELGRGDFAQLKKTFATVSAIHIILAISMFIICEILAMWFLNTKLNIPAERMHAAEWALHCSIASFCLSLLTVPYGASVISHEKMTTFAYLSILDVVIKLIIVFLLYISPIDKLVFYAVLGFFTGVIYQVIYFMYCWVKFPECKARPAIDRKIVKEISMFVGWTFIGNAAVVLKDEGVMMLLNIFFGPVVNAAQGVAMQVNGVVTRFISGFMTAVQPQITKSYASEEVGRLNELLVKSTKFSFFLTVILIFPIINNTSTLLNVWLVEVPDHAVNFANLILVYTFIDCFTTPLYTAVLASSKIKTYEVVLTILYVLNVLCSYLALKLGMVPEAVFVLAILFKFFVLVLLLQQSKKLFDFDMRRYFRMFVARIIPILLFGCLISLAYQWFFGNDTFMKLIVFTIVFEALAIPFIWITGLTVAERQFVKNILIERLHLKKS